MRNALILRLLLACIVPFGALAQYGSTPPPKKAQPNLTCAVCGRGPLTGKVWMLKENAICDECHKVESRCAICGLPVKDGYAKTSDGRFVCKRDVLTTVLTLEQAKEIYAETSATLRTLAGGALALRGTTVNVTLFDVDYWNYRDGKPVANEMRRTGFSQTRRAGPNFTHNVLLLSAQPRAEMAAVCAHEYGHLWINENMPPAREIEPDTLEGVCELIAYKLVAARNDAAGLERIRKNPYTQGRIETVLAADASMGFAAVLEWVKSGTTKTLGAPGVAGVPVAAAPRAPVIAVAPPAPSPLPERLELTGLIGGKRPQAIIGGVIFEKNDERRVKLAGKTVIVKCLEFQERAVIISVDGAATHTTLRMDGR